MGIVKLPKPVPPSPVKVKDNVVVEADWFVAIVTSDICELVMFPLIARSTVAPVFVVAGRVVADEVEAGVGVKVGIGVEVEVGAPEIVSCMGVVCIPYVEPVSPIML